MCLPFWSSGPFFCDFLPLPLFLALSFHFFLSCLYLILRICCTTRIIVWQPIFYRQVRHNFQKFKCQRQFSKKEKVFVFFGVWTVCMCSCNRLKLLSKFGIFDSILTLLGSWFLDSQGSMFIQKFRQFSS